MNSLIGKPEFAAAFNRYIEGVRAKINDSYAKNYPSLTPPHVEYEEGGRYIRVIKRDANGSSRSVHTFIDKTNGNVLKAASYKAPVTKNPRGNILDADNGLTGVSEYGAVYLRG